MDTSENEDTVDPEQPHREVEGGLPKKEKEDWDPADRGLPHGPPKEKDVAEKADQDSLPA
jgi:hypothetical protein